MNDRWLPALIVMALIGLMFYAVSHDIHSPQQGRQPSYSSAQGSQRESAPLRQQSSPIGFGDIATLVVAVATLALAVITRRSVRVAERTLTELERPWLIVQRAKITWRDSHTLPNHGLAIIPGGNRVFNDWVITLRLKNVGRMPALIEQITFKIKDTKTLSDTPDYSNPGFLLSPRTVAVGEECDTGPVGPAPGRPDQLTFYGLIAYKGLEGTEHHTGFALNVAPYMPAFVRCEKSAYDHYD